MYLHLLYINLYTYIYYIKIPLHIHKICVFSYFPDESYLKIDIADVDIVNKWVKEIYEFKLIYIYKYVMHLYYSRTTN